MRVVTDLEAVPCPEAAEFLERRLMPEQTTLTPPKNYKDPEKIAQWMQDNAPKHQAEYEQAIADWKREWLDQISACALDPDLLQIVVLGWWPETSAQPVIVSLDMLSEADMLREFWKDATRSRLIAYAGFSYDLLALMRRSDYLSVPYTPINTDRYRSEHIDLQQKLWFNGSHRFTKGKGLKFYTRRFALGVPDDDGDGDQVGQWVAAGEWAKVRHHNLRDLERTKALAERLGFLSPQMQSQEAQVF